MRQDANSDAHSELSLVMHFLLLGGYMRADAEGAHWRVRVAWISMLIGLIVCVAGSVSFLFSAFRQGTWWGLGVLFLNLLVGLPFLIRHWRKACKSAMAFIVGYALFTLGADVPGLWERYLYQ